MIINNDNSNGNNTSNSNTTTNNDKRSKAAEPPRHLRLRRVRGSPALPDPPLGCLRALARRRGLRGKAHAATAHLSAPLSLDVLKRRLLKLCSVAQKLSPGASALALDLFAGVPSAEPYGCLSSYNSHYSYYSYYSYYMIYVIAIIAIIASIP